MKKYIEMQACLHFVPSAVLFYDNNLPYMCFAIELTRTYLVAVPSEESNNIEVKNCCLGNDDK